MLLLGNFKNKMRHYFIPRNFYIAYKRGFKAYLALSLGRSLGTVLITFLFSISCVIVPNYFTLFSTSAALEMYKMDLSEPGLEMEMVGSVATDCR